MQADKKFTSNYRVTLANVKDMTVTMINHPTNQTAGIAQSYYHAVRLLSFAHCISPQCFTKSQSELSIHKGIYDLLAIVPTT